MAILESGNRKYLPLVEAQWQPGIPVKEALDMGVLFQKKRVARVTVYRPEDGYCVLAIEDREFYLKQILRRA